MIAAAACTQSEPCDCRVDCFVEVSIRALNDAMQPSDATWLSEAARRQIRTFSTLEDAV